jgi:hypothetical protein
MKKQKKTKNRKKRTNKVLLSTVLQKLLNRLRELCPDDGYKIIDWTEFDGGSAVLPQMNELADLDLIKVKHSDENVVCVAITPTGRVLENKVKITGEMTKIAKKATYGDIKLGIFIGCLVFFSAFLGAFLGVIIANML